MGIAESGITEIKDFLIVHYNLFCIWAFNTARIVKNSDSSRLGIHLICYSKDLVLDGADNLERKLIRVYVVIAANLPKP